MNRNLLPLAIVLAALAAPTAADAETIVADPEAQQVATLGGTIVWVSGEAPGQKLMQRAPDGTISAVNAPEAAHYRNLDLGRDSDGKILATYARCTTPADCVHLWDDLDGRRASFRHLPFRDCALSTTPARWRDRVVFGLGCTKRGNGRRVVDAARSGLYYRKGTGKRIRLTAPKRVRSANYVVDAVDIRGTNVAALYADIDAYAVLRGVRRGSPATAMRTGSSEGDTDQRTIALSMAATTTVFALTQSFYGGDPAQSILHRQTANCDDHQVLTGTSESQPPLLDITAEGTSEYVVRPGAGIETYEYKPDVGC